MPADWVPQSSLVTDKGEIKRLGKKLGDHINERHLVPYTSLAKKEWGLLPGGAHPLLLTPVTQTRALGVNENEVEVKSGSLVLPLSSVIEDFSDSLGIFQFRKTKFIGKPCVIIRMRSHRKIIGASRPAALRAKGEASYMRRLLPAPKDGEWILYSFCWDTSYPISRIQDPRLLLPHLPEQGPYLTCAWVRTYSGGQAR